MKEDRATIPGIVSNQGSETRFGWRHDSGSRQADWAYHNSGSDRAHTTRRLHHMRARAI